MYAYLDENHAPHPPPTYKGKNLPLEEQVLSCKSSTHWKGRQNKKDRVASPESVPIPLDPYASCEYSSHAVHWLLSP